MSTVKGLRAAAARLFKKFTGHRPRQSDIYMVNCSDMVVEIGTVNAIVYETVRDGIKEKYYHEFKSRPVLAISHDGKQAYILAGGYRFTEKGFVN